MKVLLQIHRSTEDIPQVMSPKKKKKEQPDLWSQPEDFK